MLPLLNFSANHSSKGHLFIIDKLNTNSFKNDITKFQDSRCAIYFPSAFAHSRNYQIDSKFPSILCQQTLVARHNDFLQLLVDVQTHSIVLIVRFHIFYHVILLLMFYLYYGASRDLHMMTMVRLYYHSVFMILACVNYCK